jgi:hypothetical protein
MPNIALEQAHSGQATCRSGQKRPKVGFLAYKRALSAYSEAKSAYIKAGGRVVFAAILLSWPVLRCTPPCQWQAGQQ